MFRFLFVNFKSCKTGIKTIILYPKYILILTLLWYIMSKFKLASVRILAVFQISSFRISNVDWILSFFSFQLDQAGSIRNSDIAKELCLPPVKLHCSSKFTIFFELYNLTSRVTIKANYSTASEWNPHWSRFWTIA